MYSPTVVEARSPKSVSLGPIKVLVELQCLHKLPGECAPCLFPLLVDAAGPWLTVALLWSSRLASLNLPPFLLHIASSVCMSDPPLARSYEGNVTAVKAHLDNLPSQGPCLNSSAAKTTFPYKELSQLLETGWTWLFGGPLIGLLPCPSGSWVATKKWEQSRKGEGALL